VTVAFAIQDAIRGRLIVSCQAYPGEPMRDPRTMTQVAQAAVLGGAVGIRAQGLDDIVSIRAAVTVPLIGLVKVGHDGVFITPTLADAVAVADAGADVVALDGTGRPRPDGRTFADTVAAFKTQRPRCLLMADVSTYAEGLAAAEAGADFVGTTLAGHTDYSYASIGPDFDTLERLAADLGVPVLAEGRLHTPSLAAEALRRGAHSVVVGTAITHPTSITGWFVDALRPQGR
jgi:N-acylglucosamine-6-phosphate 2-epimerase